MGETEFLTASESHALTGFARAAEQETWLKDHGIPHRRDGKRVIVSRFHARAWLEGRAVVASNAPNLDIAPNLNSGLAAWQAARRADRIEADANVAKSEKLSAPHRARMDAERARNAAVRAIACARASGARRRAAELQRTPPWADHEAIRRVYQQAQEAALETGLSYHVDHIIPLQGRLVSGLHVHNNLQVLTALENSRKHNRFEVSE